MSEGTGAGTDAAPGAPIIGLHMIVRDEADVIERCLRSALPGVQRVMIHDTGSEDETVERASAVLGEILPPDAWAIHSTLWPDDFGAARQAALDELLAVFPDVTHVLWADADDIIVGAEHLPAWASRVGPDAAGLIAHYAYGFDPSGNLACSHYRERLVRVDALGRWTGAIHETLGTAPLPLVPLPVPLDSALLPSAAWPRDAAGVEWIHNPTRGALGRNRAILERQVSDGTADARTYFYLAQEVAVAAAIALGSGDENAQEQHDLLLEEAISHLSTYEDVRDEWTDEAYQALHRSADIHRVLGRHRRALELDQLAAERQPAWPDAWLGMAESYLALEQPEIALDYIGIGESRPYPFTPMILNPTDYTIAPLRTRISALSVLGRHAEARSFARRLAEISPADPVAGYVLREVEEKASRQAAKEALLALDECLARHDENLKALDVLNAAPYFLTNDPEVAERRMRRHQGVRHVLPGGVRRNADYYGDDNEFIPLWRAVGGGPEDDMREIITAHCERTPRAQFVLAGLLEQAGDAGSLGAMRLVDLGCNDGWLGWWLVAEHGLGEYIGLDLNDRALDGARSYGRWYPEEILARLVFDRRDISELPADLMADAVVIHEVIEHVPSPDLLVRSASRLLGPDGRVYLSTPNGAYERGNIAVWDDPSPRGHVRAMRAEDLASLCLDRGELTGLAETPDGLVSASVRPFDRLGVLDLYLGAAGGWWSPMDVLSKGLGGSETMAIRMASEMARRGWRVRVYGACSPAALNGVEYLPHWLFLPGDPRRDVLVASRCPALAITDPSGARVLWLHDASYPDLQEHLPAWDEVWCVGEWQARELGLADARVMPNAVPAERWHAQDRPFSEREPWAVYSSSPDRGLLELLQLWPRVLELAWEKGKVEPQLHIAYGFSPTYDAMQRHSPELRRTRREIEERMSLPGVMWRGAMGQPALADLQMRSRVWAYPTAFPEVSCITAMEAQMAGLAVLTTDVAELARTARPAQLVPFRSTDGWGPGDRDLYARILADLLTDEPTWHAAHHAAVAQSHRFRLEPVVDLWAERLTALRDQVARADVRVEAAPVEEERA